MNKNLLASLVIASNLLIINAQAHGDVQCEAVPKEEMRPQMDLRKKLADQGWTIRQVKLYHGCYEVYGFDEKGAPVEVFFHPKTFELVADANAEKTPEKSK